MMKNIFFSASVIPDTADEDGEPSSSAVSVYEALVWSAVSVSHALSYILAEIAERTMASDMISRSFFSSCCCSSADSVVP